MKTCCRGGHPSGTSCVYCKTIAKARALIGPGVWSCEKCYQELRDTDGELFWKKPFPTKKIYILAAGKTEVEINA